MNFVLFLLFCIHCISAVDPPPLLKELNTFYPNDLYLDDVNNIALDPTTNDLYATNTASGTIDILSFSPSDGSMSVIRSIDVILQSSPYFKLDYMTAITFSPKGYMVASLIPLNYAQNAGWLVFIDVTTKYIAKFIELKYCFAPKHLISSSDGKRLIIACEGLSDDQQGIDPEGTISVIDTSLDDMSLWRIYNVDFKDFDDGVNIKHLPSTIYVPKPDDLFSINAEPEFVAIDNEDRYVYIALQENNGVAILDLYKLQIVEIYGLGAHDFGFSGLDPSDRDNGINIKKYLNVFGLRQPDGITLHRNYLLTANEGNAKYYDTLRVNQVALDHDAFPVELQLNNDENLGRLNILNAGSKYGEDDDTGEFSKLYTFGSRDFTIWKIEKNDDDEDCSCPYPYGLKLAFSSYDDFEQITAWTLGTNGFNADFENPSFDKRSDDKGPEPESIVVGECFNGDVYAFIGLERVGGIMVYDITDIDDGNVQFVEYLNARDFSVEYDDDSRPPKQAGPVEPETLIFIADDESSEGTALLIVGYKTSASIGVYSFNCGANRNYAQTQKPPYPTNEPLQPQTADTCDEQTPCLNIDILPIVSEQSEMYEVCLTFNNKNPFCSKSDDYFEYAVTLNEEEDDDTAMNYHWLLGEKRCQIAACSESVQFAVLDGDGCAESLDVSIVNMDGVDGVECSASPSNSCEWNIPIPTCSDEESVDSPTTTTSTTTTTATTTTQQQPQNDGDNNQETNNKKESRNTFDTITNKGGHFYESAMFAILLTFSVLTCLGIIGCVIKHSKKEQGDETIAIEGDVEQEEPSEFEEEQIENN